METCGYAEEKLLLYHMQELDAQERREVAQHLQRCDLCRGALNELEQLGQALPEPNHFLPDEASLAAMRARLGRALARQATSPATRRLAPFSFVHPAPVFQAGLAVLLLAIGFLLGRQQAAEAPRLLSLPAEQAPSVFQGRSARIEAVPTIVHVDRVRSDAKMGEVELRFYTLNEMQISGEIHAPAIQQVLQYALFEEQNPAVRLHAVKALQQVQSVSRGFERELVPALAKLIEQEKNLGIRLQVLKLLRHLPQHQILRDKLIEIILRERNAAVQVAAFEALVRDDISREEANLLERAATRDTTNYIRYRLAKVLEQRIQQANRTDADLDETGKDAK